MNLLHRYAVASQCKHLNDIAASMTTSCQATGNHWSCFNMGVMQSNFLSTVAALATTFCTFCSLRGRRLKGNGKGVLGKGVIGAREKREGRARKEGGKHLPGRHCFSPF